MNRARPSAGLFVIASALLLACGDPAPDVEEENGLVATNDSVYAQTAEERDYAREAVPAEWAVDPHPELFNPGYVEADGNGVYVYDYGSMQLQVFDWSGAFIRLIGEGRGEGPGEIQWRGDVLVEDNRVWIADHRGRHVSAFSPEGAFLSRFTVEEGEPSRIASIEDDLVVSVQVITGGFEDVEAPLLTVDTEGETQQKFGAIMEAYEIESPQTIDEQLVSTSEQIIRVPRHASYLFYYDKNGDHARTVRTIDELEFTEEGEVESLNGGEAYRHPTPVSPIEYRNATVYGDTLAMHARKEERSVVDYYAAETGAYLHSVELTDRVQGAHAHRDYIVTLGDTTLTKYRVE